MCPGFFQEYLNAENILRRPYGTGENIAFNFAYNLMTLRFMKASQQLTEDTLQQSLYYMNIGGCFRKSFQPVLHDWERDVAQR